MLYAKRAEELLAERVPFVHAVVVRAQLPTAVSAGDDAIILSDGSIEGFVGGQCAESSVRTAALGALEHGRTVLLRVLPEGEPDFPDSPGAQVVVNPCLSGGALEIFLQPLLPPPVLWVAGDSPIARSLADLAAPLGFTVRQAATEGPLGVAAAIVAGHGRDEEYPIRAALDAGVGYIGLVASRRRGAAVLAGMGLDDAERNRVHSPAGLDIGARTAPEIALSILAEIVATLRTTPASPEKTAASSSPERTAASSPERTASSLPERTVSSFPERPVETAVGKPRTAVDPVPSSFPEGTASSFPERPVETAVGKPRTAVDPVCGMTVAITEGTPHLHVAGEDHWFCGTGCRDRHARSGGR
jgi:xanthine dehydrogenase accessory factor